MQFMLWYDFTGTHWWRGWLSAEQQRRQLSALHADTLLWLWVQQLQLRPEGAAIQMVGYFINTFLNGETACETES